MRQGQQNRRGRGRGRKPQNTLSRNFESNGPDVKIRGTAAHIAEKYSSLARDALSSGDTIMAENYLQHAEHYNRIIAAAQAQVQGQAQPSPDGMNGHGQPASRTRRDGGERGDSGEGDGTQEAQAAPREEAGADGGDGAEAPAKPRRRRTKAANGKTNGRKVAGDRQSGSDENDSQSGAGDSSGDDASTDSAVA